MVATCANSSCVGSGPSDEGKLFRLDFEIASGDGTIQQRTVFVWLCSRCARQMNPRVEVTGSTVRVLLVTVQDPRLTGRSSPATVN
jgi:hypothetical protein